MAREVRLQRLDAAGGEARADAVAVEEPLEIRVNHRAAAVVMRTPGHDEDLALGFLATEGVIASRADVLGFAPHAAPNVVTVNVPPSVAGAVSLGRNFYASSSCGVCGKGTLESLAIRHPPVPEDGFAMSRATLFELPERLRAAQPTFDRTGGLHAAGLFDAEGNLVALREDVGRHNAVDKIVGWALREDRTPLAGHALLVSGRVGFEIVQKAVAAAIPIVAAVSAPSSLALETADAFGVTVAAFLRDGKVNVYTHPRRVL